MHVEGTPPCVTPGEKLNPCARAAHEWMSRGNGCLQGHWKGWRVAGRDLVAPDGTRLPVQRVLGLAWKQDMEARRDAARAKREAHLSQPVRVVVVTLREFQAQRIGAA